MRRATFAVPLIAVLTLTGCASEQSTTPEACSSVIGAWDDFETFAQTPDRDDAEMVAKRDAMIDSWEEAIADGPEWTQVSVGAAVRSMEKFADGAGSTTDATELYGLASSQLDLFRAQCVADHNLK